MATVTTTGDEKRNGGGASASSNKEVARGAAAGADDDDAGQLQLAVSEKTKANGGSRSGGDDPHPSSPSRRPAKKKKVLKKPDMVVKLTDKIYLGPINDKNVDQLRMLNRTILPVRYAQKFYDNVLLTPPSLTKLAYFKDVIVGNVCCREEKMSPREAAAAVPSGSAAATTPSFTPSDISSKSNNDTKSKHVYVMTLGVLAPYRGRGVGKAMVHYVIERAQRDGYASVYLHVHTANEFAVDFYKSLGFDVVGKIQGYYKRIDPPDCFVLARALNGTKDESE